MKLIKIGNKTYRLANNLNEWRKEVRKLWWNREGEPHHIMGRWGILKHLVENGIIISPEIHRKEKSKSLEERIEFHKLIRDLVINRFGEEFYVNLLKIRDKEKYMPKTLKWEIIE